MILFGILLSLCTVLYAQNQIKGMEYFLDADPGVGRGKFVHISSGENIMANVDVPVTEWEVGLHTIGVRVFNGQRWSDTYVKQVLVMKPKEMQPITHAEYFWDIDPGFGKAVPFSGLPSGMKVAVDVVLPTDALPSGLHTFGVRCYNGTQWTSTYSKEVYVAGDKRLINALEYFWDSDPGYGKGTLIACTPAEVVEFDLGNIIMPDTSLGTHLLYIRARSGNTWGLTSVKEYCLNAIPDFNLPKDTVCVNEKLIISDLTTDATDATTYAWDMDGDGKVDATDTGDFMYAYTKAGEYTASLAVKTIGGCTSVCYKKIVVLGTANPSVQLKINNTTVSVLNPRRTICEGDIATFSAVASNAGYKPKYEWLMNDKVIASGYNDTLRLDTLKTNDVIKVRVISSNPCSPLQEVVSGIVKMTVNAVTEVTLPEYLPVYTTEKSFILTGGKPEDGIYYIDGKETVLFNPAKNVPGMHQLTYRYTNESGCTSEVTRTLELKDGSLQLGDVNKDGTVDETDMDCLSRIIYGEKNPTYNFSVADLDKNGKENVSDIIGIAGIILGLYEPMPDAYVGSGVLSMINTSVEPGMSVPLEFTVQGDEKICGMQFDITMPDRVLLHSESPEILLAQIPGTGLNVYRLLTYTSALELLPITVSLMIEIPFDMEKRDYPIILNNITLSDAKMRNVFASATDGVLHVGKATSVDTKETGMHVYSEKGGIWVLRAENAVCSVTDTSGRLILKEMIHKNSQYIPLQVVPGIYLVELQKDGQQWVMLKLVIK